MKLGTCAGKLMQVKFVNGMWCADSIGLGRVNGGGAFGADPEEECWRKTGFLNRQFQVFAQRSKSLRWL